MTLRLLATTDIHMQLLGHDYIRDRSVGHHGFAGLASLIRQLRADAKAAGTACLLLDNGDMLQGSALEWALARQVPGPEHPLVSVLNDLDYDALGLGNHDLDHGLDLVTGLARHLAAQVICSNLQFGAQTPILPWALLRCAPPDQTQGLSVGVVSALPEKTAQWNQRELEGRARVLPAQQAVTKAVSAARAAGADIVVLLAHMGPSISADVMTDEARSLAMTPGIDAVILGHTHLRLPGGDHAGVVHVDARLGALHHRPCVMAGFDASDLAVLDLHLEQRRKGNWQVARYSSRLRPNTPDLPADAATAAAFAPAHAHTRRMLARRCGTLDRPLQNYFSLAVPTGTCALAANAKYLAVADALQGTPSEGTPILAAVAAHTAGGRGGPGHFLHIPAGGVYCRQLMGLSPYANEIWALRVTGRDLRIWLETAAEVYSQLGPEPQPLRRPDRPAFDFDTIFGLTYTIDPTRPGGRRISDLRHAGAAVDPAQDFILATSNFRATGGGGGIAIADQQIICRTGVPMLAALEHSMTRRDAPFHLASHPWQLTKAGGGIRADLHTAPEALEFLDDIAAFSPRPMGRDAQGFEVIRLTL